MIKFIVTIFFLALLIGCESENNFLEIRDRINSESIYEYNQLENFLLDYTLFTSRDTTNIQLFKNKEKLFLKKIVRGDTISMSRNLIITKDTTIKGWNKDFMNEWVVNFYKVFYVHNQFYESTLTNEVEMDYKNDFFNISPIEIEKEGAISKMVEEMELLKKEYLISFNDTLIRKYHCMNELIIITSYMKVGKYQIPNKILIEGNETIIINKFSIK